jgi:hypothetical protein
MKNITLTLYEIDELPEDSVNAAIKEYAEINVRHDWWEFTYDFFVDICKAIGVTVKPTRIWFRGFYSQGDGSAFEGSLDVKRTIATVAGKAWQEEYPTIQLEFPICPLHTRIIGLIAKGWIEPTFEIKSDNRGTSICTTFSYVDYGYDGHPHPRIEAQMELLEHWLEAITRSLNRLLYRSLQDEYEYLTCRDAIGETIRINEYLFTRDGTAANYLETLTTVTHSSTFQNN